MKFSSHVTSPTPLVSCVMPTYGRPEYVHESTSCFLSQDYPSKELVIVNDCKGQLFTSDLPNVRVVNIDDRFPTLGDKRNYAVSQCRGEVIAVWDDDDLSCPWRLSHSIARMREYNTPLYRPAEFLAYWGAEPFHDNYALPDWLSHGMITFTKDVWEAAGKYPPQNVQEDSSFTKRVGEVLNTGHVTYPISKTERFYVMRGTSDYFHSSINGGLGPLDTASANVHIKPRAVKDPLLNRLYTSHCNAYGAFSHAAQANTKGHSTEPIVSVCFSLKNRSRIKHEHRILDNFVRTVRSISDAAEELGHIEVVVADFHSGDWPIAEWLRTTGNMSVKILDVEGSFSVGKGRNIAAANATSEYLFFNDADVLVRTEALRRGLVALKNNKARFPFVKHLDVNGNEQSFDPYNTGIVFVKKEWILASGGYPEFHSWGGEDDILCNRIAALTDVEREHDPDLLHQWHPEWTRHQHYELPRRLDYHLRSMQKNVENLLEYFYAEHPEWGSEKREIMLFKDGSFQKSWGDRGRYEFDKQVALKLHWDNSPMQELIWNQETNCYEDQQDELKVYPMLSSDAR